MKNITTHKDEKQPTYKLKGIRSVPQPNGDTYVALTMNVMEGGPYGVPRPGEGRNSDEKQAVWEAIRSVRGVPEGIEAVMESDHIILEVSSNGHTPVRETIEKDGVEGLAYAITTGMNKMVDTYPGLISKY